MNEYPNLNPNDMNDMNVSPHLDNFAEFTNIMDKLAGEALREAIKCAILSPESTSEERESMLRHVLESLDVYEKLIKQGVLVRIRAKVDHVFDEENTP